MKLFIGVTKQDELYFIEWDKVDNEQRKTFTLSGGLYNSPKTEEQGEEEAKETLKDSSYWEDLGYLNNSSNNPLFNHIDFNSLADEILSYDGWENVNGEYSHFGEFAGKEVYLNCSSGGQHQENIKDLKEIWISEEDFKKINDLWDKEHLKPLKEETLKFMDSILEKYKSLCSEEEALNKYLKCIKWLQ
jgi:hypothetical protein